MFIAEIKKFSRKNGHDGAVMVEQMSASLPTSVLRDVSLPLPFSSRLSIAKRLEANNGSDERQHISPTAFDYIEQQEICAYGTQLLGLLHNLHCNMILGAGVNDILTLLKFTMAQPAPCVKDAQLNELIAAIRLRAAVEVAKCQTK